ncbi:MAG TPA: hypothetical protein VMA34_18640 [Terracidiphilus sp.]|nr:hypothetical protein [Terracidiphilus sp.]
MKKDGPTLILLTLIKVVVSAIISSLYMPKEGEWWDQDIPWSTPERGLHAKEVFDSLSAPLQEIARSNPEIADELVDLYQWLLMEVLSRVNRGIAGRTRALSKERTEQMVRHLASARVEFPHFD